MRVTDVFRVRDGMSPRLSAVSSACVFTDWVGLACGARSKVELIPLPWMLPIPESHASSRASCDADIAVGPRYRLNVSNTRRARLVSVQELASSRAAVQSVGQ